MTRCFNPSMQTLRTAAAAALIALVGAVAAPAAYGMGVGAYVQPATGADVAKRSASVALAPVALRIGGHRHAVLTMTS